MMKMKTIVATTTLMILMTACERSAISEARNERSDSAYKAAMDDYTAGRIEAAIKGFEKVVKKSPDNSSARFQLACLLQDFKHDSIGAYCGFHEFLLQQPDSDKAIIAKSRLAACERLLASELAMRYSISSNLDMEKEKAKFNKRIAEFESQLVNANSNITELRERNNTLQAEHQRLLASMTEKDKEDGAPVNLATQVENLLNEEEESVKAASSTKDVIAGLKAEEAEELSSGSSLLPQRKAEDLEARAAIEAKEAEQQSAMAMLVAESTKRPKKYVVESGDTLRGIAKRFYGSKAAWERIRDANKTVTTPSGDVKAGVTIVLP